MTSRAQRYRSASSPRPSATGREVAVRCALGAVRPDRAIRHLTRAADELDEIKQPIMAAHCRAFADKLKKG